MKTEKTMRHAGGAPARLRPSDEAPGAKRARSFCPGHLRPAGRKCERGAALLLALCLCAGLAGCGSDSAGGSSAPESMKSPIESQADSTAESGAQDGTVTLSGSDGGTAAVPLNPRVVCLYGSYSEAWLLAGGRLAGTTQDAVEERGLELGDAEIVGTVKEPNAEAIIALEPDLVILSSDIAAQQDMLDVLEDAGLSCLSYQVDTFEDYSAMMYQFCKATDRPDLFEENVSQVAKQIQAAKEKYTFEEDGPTVLLMRAFSTGIKAKTDDELAGAILKELGCKNIADEHPSMLEDLSLEEVISADPDFIFVTTMGDEEKALNYLDGQIAENPAWQELTAVKEGRFHVLPKDLFHYKPNHRWGESYEYLGELLQPQS